MQRHLSWLVVIPFGAKKVLSKAILLLGDFYPFTLTFNKFVATINLKRCDNANRKTVSVTVHTIMCSQKAITKMHQGVYFYTGGSLCLGKCLLIWYSLKVN